MTLSSSSAKAAQERRVREARQVSLAPMGLKGVAALAGHRGQLDLKVFWVNKAFKVPVEIKEQEVYKDFKGVRDLLVHQARRDPPEVLGFKDLWVFKAQGDRKAFRELKDHKVFKASLVIKVLKVNKGAQVRKV